jgi:hypothetical protein
MCIAIGASIRFIKWLYWGITPGIPKEPAVIRLTINNLWGIIRTEKPDESCTL